MFSNKRRQGFSFPVRLELPSISRDLLNQPTSLLLAVDACFFRLVAVLAGSVIQRQAVATPTFVSTLRDPYAVERKTGEDCMGSSEILAVFVTPVPTSTQGEPTYVRGQQTISPCTETTQSFSEGAPERNL